MRYVGLDYGSRNIGIAITDASGALAFPQCVIPNDKQALASIVQLIQKEQIGRIIMGDTRANNGTGNIITPDAERFAEALGADTGIPVTCASESWSSYEAARYAPGDVHDDSVAAAIILQRYIDMHANNDDAEASSDELE